MNDAVRALIEQRITQLDGIIDARTTFIEEQQASVERLATQVAGLVTERDAVVAEREALVAVLPTDLEQELTYTTPKPEAEEVDE